ncbi:transposase [Burkholderia metallica]|uniref:transposase n=1 Tax=Burkholderia metallica TaxID=488729 RepID=UPI00157A770E|nr:transposase [Burkholderia metallica]
MTKKGNPVQSVDDIDLGITEGAVVGRPGAVEQLASAELANVVAADSQPMVEEGQRDLVNQLLGQAQAADAIRQISQTIGVSKLAYVKETKLYRALKGMKAPNGLELSGTWEEFCGLLGHSDEKVNQDIANLRAFGEEALESMSRMGIGYRELRQFRKLPDDQRAALIAAAKGGDKDELLDLAEELLEKERAVKADLEAKAAGLEEDVSGLKRREKNYEAELERLNSKVKRLSEDRKRTTDLLPRTEEIREESMALQLEAELPLNRLQKLFAEVNSDGPEAPECQLQLEHLWIVANVVAARALDLVALIKETACIDDLPHRVTGTHILTPDEAQQWLLDYATIENRHAAAIVARQEKRDAAKPRGVGRPKKSSNKEQGE